MIELLNFEPSTNRNLYILKVNDYELNFDLSKFKYYIAFIAEELTQIQTSKLNSFIEKLIDDGMVYLNSWGTNCELIHDSADFILSDPNNRKGYHERFSSDESIILTTWHKNDSLSEAIYFSLYNSFPADEYSDETVSVILLVLDSDTLYQKIKDRLLNLDKLKREVLE